MEIAIDFKHQTVVVPGLAGPEPHPAGAADEGTDDNHGNPQHDEAEAKGEDSNPALLEGVVAVAQRVGVHVGNGHQPDDDERGHDHAGDPGIEIDQHLLQAQEVPGGLGRVHGQVGVGRFFQRGVQGDGPDHEDDGNNQGNQKLHPHQVGPDVDFLFPARFPRLGFAVMGLGLLRVGFQFCNQAVVGDRLPQAVPGIEGNQEQDGHNRDVVRSGGNFPELVPVHLIYLLFRAVAARFMAAGAIRWES